MHNPGHKYHGYAALPAICVDCADERREQAAAIELDHNAQIDNLVDTFPRQAEAAVAAVAKVRRTLSDLVSDCVYDIELAEGPGGDALHELDTALRSLRHVQRIAYDRRRLLTEKEGAPDFS